MYLSMTLILIILIILVIIFFRSVKGVIYLIGTAEVFFQLMHYFADNIGVAGNLLFSVKIYSEFYFQYHRLLCWWNCLYNFSMVTIYNFLLVLYLLSKVSI